MKVSGIPKSKERLRVEQEILEKGWALIQAQPARTLPAAKSLLYVAAGTLGLDGQIRVEGHGNRAALGYVPTIVDDDWESELPEDIR